MLGFIKGYLTKQNNKKEYVELLKKFLSDNKLDEVEKKELESLAKEYGLSEEELKSIQKNAFSHLFSNVATDQRITEEEKSALNELLGYFKLEKDEIDFDQKSFNKYYCLAMIDKGILPEIQANGLNVIFKPGEVVHWACPAALKKMKNIVQRIHYSGPSASIRIMKGFRYRVGSINVRTDSKEVLVTEDTGTFWFTNRRVGFVGNRKNFTLPYNKILYFEVTGNGLMIAKEGKDAPYLIKLDDYDVPCSILSFILNK